MEEKTLQQIAGEAFLANYDSVLSVAFRFAPLPDLVDDVLQETFNIFVSRAECYDLKTETRFLLMKIAKNVALGFWKQRQRERSKVAQLIFEHVRQYGESLSAPEEDTGCYSREQGALGTCLEKLSPQNRDIVRQHYFQKLPIAEIASQYQTTTDAIKQLLFRIRKKLRICIDKRVRQD